MVSASRQIGLVRLWLDKVSPIYPSYDPPFAGMKLFYRNLVVSVAICQLQRTCECIEIDQEEKEELSEISVFDSNASESLSLSPEPDIGE